MSGPVHNTTTAVDDQGTVVVVHPKASTAMNKAMDKEGK